MNELSWMIYAADVAGTMNNLFVAAGCILLVGAGVFAGPVADIESNGLNSSSWRKHAKRCAIGCAIVFTFAVFIPSQDTIYAIAASEMGEELLNSETGGKAVEALNAWLDRQIGEDQ